MTEVTYFCLALYGLPNVFMNVTNLVPHNYSGKGKEQRVFMASHHLVVQSC